MGPPSLLIVPIFDLLSFIFQTAFSFAPLGLFPSSLSIRRLRRRPYSFAASRLYLGTMREADQSIENVIEDFFLKELRRGGLGGGRKKQGVPTENLWPKLFSGAPRCAPLRLFLHLASGMPSVSR